MNAPRLRTPETSRSSPLWREPDDNGSAPTSGGAGFGEPLRPPERFSIMKATPALPVSLPILRRAALDAAVHEKTAVRALRGLPVRPAGRDRLMAALSQLGVDVRALPAACAATPDRSETT